MPVAFAHVVELLETLERLQLNPKTHHKTIQSKSRSCLFSWFEHFRSDIANSPRTLLAIQSALLPHLRPDRVYNLREEGLSRALAKQLCVWRTRRAPDLLEWRTTTRRGDLGSAVQKVMKETEVDERGEAVTVEQLEDALDRLACRSVFSDAELRRRVKAAGGVDTNFTPLLTLFYRLSSVEAKWVTRIVLKNHLMKIPGVYPWPVGRD